MFLSFKYRFQEQYAWIYSACYHWHGSSQALHPLKTTLPPLCPKVARSFICFEPGPTTATRSARCHSLPTPSAFAPDSWARSRNPCRWPRPEQAIAGKPSEGTTTFRQIRLEKSGWRARSCFYHRSRVEAAWSSRQDGRNCHQRDVVSWQISRLVSHVLQHQSLRSFNHFSNYSLRFGHFSLEVY